MRYTSGLLTSNAKEACHLDLLFSARPCRVASCLRDQRPDHDPQGDTQLFSMVPFDTRLAEQITVSIAPIRCEPCPSLPNALDGHFQDLVADALVLKVA